MSFHEPEQHFLNLGGGEFKSRSNSDSRGHRKSESEIRFSTLQRKKPSIHRDMSDDPNTLENMEVKKWNCPKENLWTPTVQAVTEYKMIRDGTDILKLSIQFGNQIICR